MTVLVDMDDVLERLVAGWVEFLNERHGTNVTPEEVTDWNIALAFPELTYEQVFAPEYDDALWDRVRPMPGADEGLRTLLEEGHEIYIVTATRYQTLRTKMEKVLFRYFPYLTWDQVIVTTHKDLICGDVLIDDGPHNLQSGGYRKILFDAPHNRSFDESTVGAVRVHNWQEACAEVRKLAEMAQREQDNGKKQ